MSAAVATVVQGVNTLAAKPAVTLPPDTSPPVVQLVGDPILTWPLTSTPFVDPGCIAADDQGPTGLNVTVSGIDVLKAVLAAHKLPVGVPYDAAKQQWGPFVLSYAAADASGNTAAPARRVVYLVSGCAAGEFLCADVTCSIAGLCGVHDAALVKAFASAADDPRAKPVQFVPLVDTTPPVISVHYSARDVRASTQGGNELVITTVLVGSTWVDAGADAMDDTDGRVPVSSFGATAVDTSHPVDGASSFLVRYSAQDAAGNVAKEGFRAVVVACPPTERVCPGDAPGSDYCSTSQICVDLTPPPPQTSQQFVSITLRGPPWVAIEAGRSYPACPRPRPVDMICDLGARAQSALEGRWDQYVVACRPGFFFADHGLAGCAVDTSVAGASDLVFTVEADASVVPAPATRVLEVLPRCETGEARCLDGSCDPAALCLSGGFWVPRFVNTPPVIQLLRLAGQASAAVVDVPYGAGYVACSPGQQPTAAQPCEPGVVATDAEDGDLTLRVVTCPSSSCLSVGCVGFEFVKKGLAGCLPLDMPVDSVYNISFQVWDDGMPAASATATRFVRILSPCASGEIFCATLQQQCGTSACDTRSALLTANPARTAPTVAFVNDARVASSLQTTPGAPANASATLALTAACNAPLPVNVTVCGGVDAAAAGCGVSVADTVDVDLGGRALVDMDLGCHERLAGPSGCALCRLEDAVAGSCPVGEYVYHVSAVNSERQVADAVTVKVSVKSRAATASASALLRLSFANDAAAQIAAAGGQALEHLMHVFGGATSATSELLQTLQAYVQNVAWQSEDPRCWAFQKAGVQLEFRWGAPVTGVLNAATTSTAGGVVLTLNGSLEISALLPVNASPPPSGSIYTIGDCVAVAVHEAGLSDTSISNDFVKAEVQGRANLLTRRRDNVSFVPYTLEALEVENVTVSSATCDTSGDAAVQFRGLLAALQEGLRALTLTIPEAYSTDLTYVEIATGASFCDVVDMYMQWYKTLVLGGSQINTKYDLRVSASYFSGLALLARTKCSLAEAALSLAPSPPPGSSSSPGATDPAGLGSGYLVNTATYLFFNRSSRPPTTTSSTRTLHATVELAHGKEEQDATPPHDSSRQKSRPQVKIARAGVDGSGTSGPAWLTRRALQSSDAATAVTAVEHDRSRAIETFNQVLGGVVLHQTRSSVPINCKARTGQLSTICTLSGKLLEVATQLTGPMAPFGFDPAFVPTSRLFNPAIQARVAEFYNTSTRSGEISLFGSPYGIFAREMPGFDRPGFPVVFQTYLDQGTIAHFLSYLQEGKFVDRYTERLVVNMVTFNSRDRCYGVFHLTVKRALEGVFRGHASIRGLADTDYYNLRTVHGQTQLGLDLTSIAMGIVYIVWGYLSAGGARAPGQQAKEPTQLGWWLTRVADAVQCAYIIMYIVTTVRKLGIERSQQQLHRIYDDPHAAARIFLPAKLAEPSPFGDAVWSNASTPECILSGGDLATAVAAPAWALKDDNAGLAAFAAFQSQVLSAAFAEEVASVLGSATYFIVIAHWASYATQLPGIAVCVNAVVHVLPMLIFDFALPLSTLCILFAFFMDLVAGPEEWAWSSWRVATQSAARGFFGDRTLSSDEPHSSSVEMDAVLSGKLPRLAAGIINVLMFYTATAAIKKLASDIHQQTLPWRWRDEALLSRCWWFRTITFADSPGRMFKPRPTALTRAATIARMRGALVEALLKARAAANRLGVPGYRELHCARTFARGLQHPAPALQQRWRVAVPPALAATCPQELMELFMIARAQRLAFYAPRPLSLARLRSRAGAPHACGDAATPGSARRSLALTAAQREQRVRALALQLGGADLSGRGVKDFGSSRRSNGADIFGGSRRHESADLFGSRRRDGADIFGSRRSDGADIFGSRRSEGAAGLGSRRRDVADALFSNPLFSPSGDWSQRGGSPSAASRASAGWAVAQSDLRRPFRLGRAVGEGREGGGGEAPGGASASDASARLHRSVRFAFRGSSSGAISSAWGEEPPAPAKGQHAAVTPRPRLTPTPPKSPRPPPAPRALAAASNASWAEKVLHQHRAQRSSVPNSSARPSNTSGVSRRSRKLNSALTTSTSDPTTVAPLPSRLAASALAPYLHAQPRRRTWQSHVACSPQGQQGDSTAAVPASADCSSSIAATSPSSTPRGSLPGDAAATFEAPHTNPDTRSSSSDDDETVQPGGESADSSDEGTVSSSSVELELPSLDDAWAPPSFSAPFSASQADVNRHAWDLQSHCNTVRGHADSIRAQAETVFRPAGLCDDAPFREIGASLAAALRDLAGTTGDAAVSASPPGTETVGAESRAGKALVSPSVGSVAKAFGLFKRSRSWVKKLEHRRFLRLWDQISRALITRATFPNRIQKLLGLRLMSVENAGAAETPPQGAVPGARAPSALHALAASPPNREWAVDLASRHLHGGARSGAESVARVCEAMAITLTFRLGVCSGPVAAHDFSLFSTFSEQVASSRRGGQQADDDAPGTAPCTQQQALQALATTAAMLADQLQECNQQRHALAALQRRWEKIQQGLSASGVDFEWDAAWQRLEAT